MSLLHRWSAAALPVLVLLICGFNAQRSQPLDVPVIVTAAPIYDPLAGLRGEERFPKGAQLLLLKDGSAAPLVEGFAASADANVYFDGTVVLFAGKQSAADRWQIWELNLADHSVRRVLAADTDAERPFYLPGGRMVYALRTETGFRMESVEDGHPLSYTPLNPTTGPGELDLSYGATNAFPANVLADGRVLFESGFPLGSGTVPELYLVYADGSGVESYRCDHGRGRWGGVQLASGDVAFTHGSSLARFTSSLAQEVGIAAPPAQYAGAIAEMASGDWLLSTRASASARYVLKRWMPGSAAMETVLAESGANLVEPVLVAPRSTPKRHPSGLHPWDYANLLALDARLSRDGAMKGTPVAVRLETQDAAQHAVTLGTAPVEKDGSFFVQVPGDTPIRFALLDAKGAVLRQERGWFWARRGEQRICVGCHTGPERASDNRVPAVLLRTTTPFDLRGSGHETDAGGR